MSSPELERLSEHLYLVHDTCDVYVITAGDRALCIDFGAGAVCESLGEIGVSGIDWVLHTHHHRDQCQGDDKARDAGARIAVPRYERFLFDEVENFWRNRRLYDVYNVRNTYFSLTKNLPVDAELADYETFEWQGIGFRILPTPGHTIGSITIIATIDERRVGFVGDLISSPGKVQTLYDLQYDYGAFDGVNQAVLSLASVRAQGCDLLCPSHGAVMSDVESAIDATMGRLRGFYEFNTGQPMALDNTYDEIAPGVFGCSGSCSSHYAMISKSGKALFIDYGSAGPEFLQPHLQHDGEAQRFVRHSTDVLRERFGMTSIDVAIPSHYHDDHICGFPYLQKHENTQIWCYENMKEVLENPHVKNIGCLIPDPVRVDRPIPDGQRIRWEEFTFTVHYSPGHADYHMSLFLEHEGRRIAFTGDNIFSEPDIGLQHSLIYRNHVHLDSHVRTARLVMNFEPDTICPGHGPHFNVTTDRLEQFVDRTGQLRRHFMALTDGPVPDHGVDIDWISLYPFQPQALPGESFELACRVTNYSHDDYVIDAEPVLPDEWTSQPGSLRFEVPAKEKGEARTTITLPSDETRGPKMALAMDITINGKHLGQRALAVVNLRGLSRVL